MPSENWSLSITFKKIGHFTSIFRQTLRGDHSYPLNHNTVFYTGLVSLYIVLLYHMLLIHISHQTRLLWLLQELHFLIIFKLWGAKTPLKWRFFEMTSLYTLVVLNELYNFWPIRIDVYGVVGALGALKVLYVWLCEVTLAKPVF